MRKLYRIIMTNIMLLISFTTITTCADTMRLASLKYQVEKQNISRLPAKISFISAVISASYLSWIGQYLITKKYIPKTDLGGYAHIRINGMRFTGIDKWLAPYLTDQQKQKWFCWSVDRATYYALGLLELWGIYKAGSITQKVINTIINRNKWLYQTMHILQEQMKIIAILRSIQTEFTESISSFEDEQLAAIVSSSNITGRLDQLIKDHVKHMRETLAEIAELTNRYAHLKRTSLVDEAIKQAFCAVNEDLYTFVFTENGMLDRSEVSNLLQHDDILLKAVTNLYQAQELIAQHHYPLVWKGARKANTAMRTLYHCTKDMLNRHAKSINQSLKAAKHMLWFQAKMAYIPLINRL